MVSLFFFRLALLLVDFLQNSIGPLGLELVRQPPTKCLRVPSWCLCAVAEEHAAIEAQHGANELQLLVGVHA